MSKRQEAKEFRRQEALAVTLYNRGKRLKDIKRRCPMVESWTVRGLAFAANLRTSFARS